MVATILLIKNHWHRDATATDVDLRTVLSISQDAQKLFSCHTLQEFYTALLKIVHESILCQQIVVYYYNSVHSLYMPVACWSATDKEPIAPVDPEAIERAGREQILITAGTAALFPPDLLLPVSSTDTQALIVQVASHRHCLQYRRLYDAQGESVTDLAVPFMGSGLLPGVLLLRRATTFHPRELRLLSNLCSQAASIWQVLIDKERLTAVEEMGRQAGRAELQAQQTHFISLIAHELRSPLHLIHGYLDLALMGLGGELNAQQREFIQRSREASQLLYILLENLLCMARADLGPLQLHRTLLNLPAIVNDIVEEFAVMAADRRIILKTSLKTSSMPQIYADHMRIQQILRNLLLNALQFTPPDGIVDINTSLVEMVLPTLPSDPGKNGTTCICLSVRDTGIGIAENYHQRVFERFFRILDADAQIEHHSGQGLGLAIVKLIVEAHGGSVSVNSVPGQGSVFHCYLPALSF